MRFRFDKIDGFNKIRVDNKVRYSMFLDFSYCDKVCDKIKYLISQESGIRDSINHNFERIRIDECLYIMKAIIR